MKRIDWLRLLTDDQLAQFIALVAGGGICGIDRIENAVKWLNGEMGDRFDGKSRVP